MKLEKARAKALFCLPYLARLAFSVRVRESRAVPTACVSERWVMWVNPEFWEGLSLEEQAFVLLHEWLHLALSHGSRRGERNPELWNLAADLLVNETLERGRNSGWPIKLIDGAARGEQFSLWACESMTVEEIYEHLLQGSIKVQVRAFSGACGSGGGGKPYPVEAEDPGVPQAQREVLARSVQESLRDCGHLPAGLHRELQELLAPKVNWRAVLRSLLRGSVAHALGKMDYTFRRPSRRSGDVVLPSLASPKPRVVAVIDTSGSIGEGELAQEVGEVLALAREAAELEVLACDAEVHGRARVRRLQDVQAILRGGGGTDMGRGIQEALKLRPDVIVVLTDGYTPWPAEPPRVPVIVALFGDGKVPPWAKVVEVPH